MDDFAFDPYTICMVSSNEIRDVAIQFWLNKLSENSKGKINIISLQLIPQSIIKKNAANQFVWREHIGSTISELSSIICQMDPTDSLLIIGAEKLRENSNSESTAQSVRKNSLQALEWVNYAGSLDQIFDQAQKKKLFGCIVMTYIAPEYKECFLSALEDSPNMSIMEASASSEEPVSLPLSGLAEKMEAEQALLLIEQHAAKVRMDVTELIEYLGNCYERHRRFQEAALVFGRLSGKYYEMLVCLNHFLASGKTALKAFQDNVLIPFQDDPVIFHEAIFRAAAHFVDSQHQFAAYQILSQVDPAHCVHRGREIAELKLKILEDTTTASAALRKIKPLYNDSNALLLAQERCRVLLESLPVLAMENAGYYRWREFIECQSSKAWVTAIPTQTRKILRELQSIDWNSRLEQSYPNKLINQGTNSINCAKAIDLLRRSDYIETLPPCDRVSTGDVMWRIKNLSLMQGSAEERLWIQYYIARNDMFFSNDVQLSINSSLALMEMAQSESGEQNTLGISLYLVSWGSLQYRIGNQFEGVLCCLAAIMRPLDATVLLEDAINTIAKYIGEQVQAGIIGADDDCVEFLVSICNYNQTVESIVGLIKGGSFSQISSLKDRVSQQPHNSEWMIDLTNLVQALHQEGKHAEAARYLSENLEELVHLADLREDAAHNLLFSWAQLLMYSNPTPAHLKSCISLLEQAMEKAMKRRNAFHQDERSGISVSFHSILREYLFVNGLLYLINNISPEYREELKSNLLKAAALYTPLSIIEQKKYQVSRGESDSSDQEAIKLEKMKAQYYALLARKSAEDPEVSALASQINELTEQLVKSNPYYRPLDTLQGTNWDEIMHALPERDVCYQFIFTKNLIISILCTQSKTEVVVRVLESKYDPIEIMDSYGNMVASGKQLGSVSEKITDLVATPLIQYMRNHPIHRLFIIPEMQSNIFPFAAAKLNGTELIDQVSEIVNLIDHKALLRYVSADKRSSTFFPVYNRLYGNLSDPSISKLYRWLSSQKNECFSVEYCKDDCEDPFDKHSEGKAAGTIAIYGHGAASICAGELDGALRIAGISHMINMNPILQGLKSDHLIVISCLSGSINENTPETAIGIWKSVFEQYAGNIILCKWSVPTQSTISLMNLVYEHMKGGTVSLGNALVLAQRTIRLQMPDPQEWAGVEFWIN